MQDNKKTENKQTDKNSRIAQTKKAQKLLAKFGLKPF